MEESNKDSVEKDVNVGMKSAQIIGEKVARTALMLQLGNEALKNM